MKTCLSCVHTHHKEGGTLTCQRYPTPAKVGVTYVCGEYKQEEKQAAANPFMNMEKRRPGRPPKMMETTNEE